MSFGVGFGDIVKAIDLAKSLVATYRGAPGQVKEIANDISRVFEVLNGAHAILQRKEKDLTEYEKKTMLSILEGYMIILDKLSTMHNEYYTLAAGESHGIGSHGRKIGKRLAFDSSLIKDYRQEIIHCNTMLSSFLGLLNTSVSFDTHRKVEALVEYKSSQEDQKILTWLSSLDFGKQHTDRLRRREPGTGTWFTASERFQGWLDQPETTLLCHGIPGAGKSFLASIVIDYLQQCYFHDPEICVTFLLCDFNSEHEQAPEDLLANLLKQLTQGRPVPADLQQLFVQYKSKPFGCRPMIDELHGYLVTALSSRERTFVIVDALDEYRADSRTRLLEEMFRLQKSSILSILITSRPVQEVLSAVEEWMTNLHMLEIRAHQEDITRFLNRRINENLQFLKRRPKEVRESVQQEICLTISQAVDGMFLLAALYFDAISKCWNVNKIRESMIRLPRGPDAYGKLYGNTMTRIQSRKTRDLAMQVLCWVAWTKRPLTGRELQHALAIADGATTLDENSITDTEDMLSSCEGLVTMDPKTEIVRLVHYTTQEYLETIREIWFPSAENDILRVCLTIISSLSFETGHCLTDEDFAKRLQDYPLYHYACRHWGDHATASTAMDDSLLAFLQDAPKVDAASQCQLTYRGRCRSIPTGVSGLHLAARYGLHEVVNRLLFNGYGANLQTSYGESPIFSAAAHGFHSIVVTLLQHKAQVNSKDMFGRTVLFVAAEHGHLEIAKTLVTHGAYVDVRDCFGRSPISDAAEAGHEAMVSYLLHLPDVQADAEDEHGKTPLWRAASKGHWEVVKTLVSHGADIDTHLQGQPTPLIRATMDGKKNSVEQLITMGANIQLSVSYGPPLVYAAHFGFTSIMEVLLDKGADLNLADENGWTALILACASGRLDATALLLQQDSTALEHTDRYGQTPLSIASRMGHVAIVKLLLEKDTDKMTVSQPDGSGWTPLIQASKHGSREVLELLLEEGRIVANFGHYDHAGKTALHWASRLGNTAAVQSLIDAGAPIDARDSALRTPLWYAARNGHFETVEALVAGGCCRIFGRRAAQNAIAVGHRERRRQLRRGPARSRGRIGS